jgi:ADP-ribose pyrophosphatase
MKKTSEANQFAKIPKDSQRIFHSVKFDVYAVELGTADGHKAKREVVVHPGAVVILPVLDKENIILIRNERFAVGKILWELPAGTLEPNEPPQATAYRELIEETGYQAKTINALLTFYTSPGFCNEIMYAYVAEDLKHVGQNLEATEKITVEPTSLKKALQMIHEGMICDAKTIATLLYYNTFSLN